MAYLRIDVLLDNADIASTVDPSLQALLRRLRTAAEEEDKAQSEQFDTYIVTVTTAGDVEVDTSGPTAFDDWVSAAGDLAHHVGPRSGMVKGERTTVGDILGGAEMIPVEPPASPLAVVEEGMPPTPTSQRVTPFQAFLCGQCGTLHEFVPMAHRCGCGGMVERCTAVHCGSCGQVLVLDR